MARVRGAHVERCGRVNWPDQAGPSHRLGITDGPLQVDSQTLGIAHSLQDLSVFLERAGLEGLDEVDVANSHLIEWHGGGPEVWSAPP